MPQRGTHTVRSDAAAENAVVDAAAENAVVDAAAENAVVDAAAENAAAQWSVGVPFRRRGT
jgi:hypothetical protein